ncbi:MAG: hypothetical protein HY680_01500 [Chloroflexi bacterium]|nr:hypothetical protein [Chloroflexota bacterium]
MTSKRTRLLEVDYDRGEGVTIHVRPRAARLLPRASLRHWRNANKEMLLAFRSMLDSAIERMDPGDDASGEGQSRGARHVPVTEETQ